MATRTEIQDAKIELEMVIYGAKLKGVRSDGQWVRDRLERLGWVALAYAENYIESIEHRCGYHGCYATSIMVKKL